MNIAESLFGLSQFESMKKQVADKMLEEVTHEDKEQQRKSKEESVPADKGMENIQKKTDRGTGSDLSVLQEEDETSSMPPRRRKRRKLSKPESR